MKIFVNGEIKTTQSKTIKALIDELNIENKVMAAAVNMEVVKKELWSSYEFAENDRIEFLQFVGGG